MKKSLLFIAALFVAAAASAQGTLKSVELQQNTIPTCFDMKYFKVEPNVTTPRHTKSSGVYYRRPQGAYYTGWDIYTDSGYAPSLLNVTPWHEFMYENMIPNKKGTWHQWYWNSDNTVAGDVLITPDATVVDGDYYWSQEPGYWYYTPTLRLGKDSFCIGTENLYVCNANYGPRYSARVATDSVSCWNVADDHQRYLYQGTNYNNTAAWGALSDNMYGSGVTDVTVGGEKVDCPCYMCEQIFDRPMTPLYLERVYAKGCSFSRQPIGENDTLWCYITNVVEYETEDGEKVKYSGDKVLAELYAVAEDTIGFSMSDRDTRNNKIIYEGTVMFYQRTVDIFGIERLEPVTIDPAELDENGFAMVFVGFDNPNIDFGAYGYRLNDDVDDIEEGRFYVYNPNTNDSYNFQYTAPIAMQVGMVAMYDAVEVINNEMDNGSVTNALRVSNDGQTCSTDGAAPGSDYDLGAVPVYTAQPWYDEELTEYYELVDAPEWVIGAIVDESARMGDDNGQYVGLDFVSVMCEPLPADVSGRYAVCYVKGRGVTSEYPIYILQGDATLADGITATTMAAPVKDNRIFNLNGQRVNRGERGILIQNGKKFVNK